MKLPRVTGSSLARRKMTFPDDFEGEINLVFVAFQRWHQDLIDEWAPYVAQLAQEYSQLRFYEFPTLPSRGAIYRTFLNEGMRAGIPDPATRARTVTLYLDTRAFRKALDIDSDRQMWVYLFDRAGEVLWRSEGRVSDEKIQAIRQLMASPPA